MDNKNNLATSIVVALVALMAGLGLVFGTGIAVQSAVAPMNNYLQQIVINQKMIDKVLDKTTSEDVKDLSKRIADLESKVTQLSMMLANV